MSKKQKDRRVEKEKLLEQNRKKEARVRFRKQFIPLMIAVLLWIVTSMILHIPSIKNEVATFFIGFTIQSSLLFGKIFFIPVLSPSFPFLIIGGYHMQVVMECTAYNFYVFVIFLSLLSPVKWKQRLLTLLIFLFAVFVVNNLRFITVGYIGSYSQDLFHLVHDYLWNILFGFIVFLIWAWRYNKSTEVNKD
jgi:exosortase/archaeosortase family protein